MRATIVKLIAAVFVSLSAGLIGSLFTAGSDFASWYDALKKPSFTPVNWGFGPVWTALYVLMGVAAFLVWQRGYRDRWVRIDSFFS